VDQSISELGLNYKRIPWFEDLRARGKGFYMDIAQKQTLGNEFADSLIGDHDVWYTAACYECKHFI